MTPHPAIAEPARGFTSRRSPSLEFDKLAQAQQEHDVYLAFTFGKAVRNLWARQSARGRNESSTVSFKPIDGR
jgi:hypothetical protein